MGLHESIDENISTLLFWSFNYSILMFACGPSDSHLYKLINQIITGISERDLFCTCHKSILSVDLLLIVLDLSHWFLCRTLFSERNVLTLGRLCWALIHCEFGIDWSELFRSVLRIDVEAVVLIIVWIFLIFIIALNVFLFFRGLFCIILLFFSLKGRLQTIYLLLLEKLLLLLLLLDLLL